MSNRRNYLLRLITTLMVVMVLSMGRVRLDTRLSRGHRFVMRSAMFVSVGLVMEFMHAGLLAMLLRKCRSRSTRPSQRYANTDHVAACHNLLPDEVATQH
jgi:hypothetical protein